MEEMVLNSLWRRGKEAEKMAVERVSEAGNRNCFYFGVCHEVRGGTGVGLEFRH